MKFSAAIIVFSFFATLTCSRSQASAKDPSAKTNILYFYVDDMGWGSIGPNGQAERRAKDLPSVQTPNLDQLAAEGVNFTRGYGCHVCSPARSSQQSGFHQGHTFADRNDPNNAKKAMRADDILMGDALSKAGYVTGYWGKWGYGGSKDQQSPVIENVQTLPTSHGYRHVLAELHHVRAHTFFQPTLWSAPAAADSIGGIELVPNSLTSVKGNAHYPDTPALQNHRDYPKTAYCDDSYAMAALDFVRTQGQNYNRTGQPFFGLLAVQIPHAPFAEISTLPDWDKAYQDDPQFQSLADQSRQWAAMVTRIDAHFGNILAALEDPNRDGDRSDSIAENTLVVFQSDNGGPGGKNRTELDANGGLTGVKGQIQEGGIRVPLVMRWPSAINDRSVMKPGTDSNMVVDVTDLLPTFCELAGVGPPLGIDGVSIAPSLTGEGTQRKRDFLIHEAGNGQSIIRGNWKLVRDKKRIQLFDLAKDRTESNDLSKTQPALVDELNELLLGERVDEPRGFSNTYHHWTGKSGADAAAAENWSVYRYENAGVTYQTDDGAPKLSWTARMVNPGKRAISATTSTDLEFLGLEVAGNAQTGAPQSLLLGDGKDLTGRNEIRIGKGGTIELNDGKIHSLRWIEILPEGMLRGSGTVNATVHNKGELLVGRIDVGGRIKLSQRYQQHRSGSLCVTLNLSNLDENGSTLMRFRSAPLVAETVQLDGTLMLQWQGDNAAAIGQRFRVLATHAIQGVFSNPEGIAEAADGSLWEIGYDETGVFVTRRR